MVTHAGLRRTGSAGRRAGRGQFRARCAPPAHHAVGSVAAHQAARRAHRPGAGAARHALHRHRGRAAIDLACGAGGAAGKRTAPRPPRPAAAGRAQPGADAAAGGERRFAVHLVHGRHGGFYRRRQRAAGHLHRRPGAHRPAHPPGRCAGRRHRQRRADCRLQPVAAGLGALCGGCQPGVCGAAFCAGCDGSGHGAGADDDL